MKVRKALDVHKHYSIKSRIQTEAFRFMYERPALRRIALAAASRLKG
jgi:hypothetical protein